MARPRSKSPPLRRRGGIWYATIYDGDVPLERSTGSGNRDEAQTVAGAWQQETADPTRDPATAEATLNDALTDLLDDRRAKVRAGDRSEKTLAFYDNKAGTLVAFFGHDFKLSAWTRDSSASWRYVRWRRETGVLDRTIRKELGALRTALYLARERGSFRGDPDLAVPASLDAGSGISTRSPSRAEFLALVPHLMPDAAAQVAFILATSAERSAVERAVKTDIPKTIRAPMVIHVRGSKTSDRDRVVPVVTDEQVVLLKFAKRYAEGKGDRLFARLPNRLIGTACTNAKIEHASPHHFRHAAGQWLLDVGVSIELVSRILGHASTSMTERVYARVKQDAVGDRILDAIDPAYAKGALRSRKKKARRVETIQTIPEPKRIPTYEIDGVALTLDGWAKRSGIAKSTLYWRVITAGHSMREALAMGAGPGRVSRQSPIAGRSTAGKLPGNSGTDRPGLAPRPDGDLAKSSGNTVGHDRLELSANGLREGLVGRSGASESRDADLARALRVAAECGRWDIVERLAALLGHRP